MSVQVLQGDCIAVMRALKDNSVDAIVTDPPYGLEFMGKDWDGSNGFRRSLNPADADRENVFGRTSKTSPEYITGKRPVINKPDPKFRYRENQGIPVFGSSGNPICRNCKGDKYRNGERKCKCDNPDFPNQMAGQMSLYQQWCQAWAEECLRVLKPGGHLLAFGGTRTYHRLACGIEDAGFEIRDSLHWVYGSGFPKSLDVSKAIDKAGGQSVSWFGAWLRAERERRGLTAHELCERGGFYKNVNHGGLVVNWELGLGTPTAAQFNKVCDLLGLGYPRIEVLEREVLGTRAVHPGVAFTSDGPAELEVTAPATEAAVRWEGWGTALKPAHEPIVVARKPLAGTVAGNVLEWGTGALNVDGCRVETPGRPERTAVFNGYESGVYGTGRNTGLATGTTDQGRWPPNILLTHSAECEPTGVRTIAGDNRQGKTGKRPGGFVDTGADAGDGSPNGPLYGDTEMQAWDCAPDCPVAELDRQTGTLKSGANNFKQDSSADSGGNSGPAYGAESRPWGTEMVSYGDQGGASRFFPCFLYQAKAKPSERPRVDGIAHPTVKPLGLMRWLVRLVTPPGGIVLDPFAGSGTTGEACLEEGFNCILIEREPDYIKLIKTRLNRREPTLWD